MPNSVLDFDKRGSNKKKQYLPQQSAQRIEQVAHALTIKTGFSNTPGVTLSFDNGTRTFTITPTGSTFEYWIEGIKFIKSSAETVVITDTEGLWYIYYIGTVLTASQTPWDNRDIDKVFVAMIHWDATNNVAIIIGYEVHSHHMSPATHNYLHETIGTNYESGLALVEGTGGNDGKIAMDSGEIHDEDIKISITDGTGSGLFEQELGNTSVFAPAQIPVYYRSGASAWRKYIAGDYPFYDNVGEDNVHYNSYSDPNWASTVASTSAKYIAMWIFGTNNQNEPVIALMGQIESDTLNAAKEDNTLQGLSFGTLPFTEMKILYRLIFKSDSTYAHTEDMRQVDNVPGGTYVPAPSEVSDEVYGTTWEAVTTLAPSKKAVYNKIELVVAGGAQFAFKTITGITNDVVADLAADTLTYTSANGILTIVGNAGTDTITFTVIEGQISLANLLEKNHASLANVTANQHINNLTDIPTRNHNDLLNLNDGDAYEHITQTQKNALHAEAHDLASHSTKAHSELSDAPTSAHHIKTVSGDIALNGLSEKDHASLANKNAETDIKHLTDDQLVALHAVLTNLTQLSTREHVALQNKNAEENVKHMTDAQINALHAAAHAVGTHTDITITPPIVANEVLGFNGIATWINKTPAEAGLSVVGHNHTHNVLTGLNDGDVYEHISQDQKNALHAVLTNLTQLATRNHADLQNKNTEENIKHLTDAQLGALHTLYTNGEAVQAVEDAGLVLSAGKIIVFDGHPNDGVYTGMVMEIDTTGCATFDAVYVDGAGSVAKAQANNISTMPAIGVVVAVNRVLTHGAVKSNASWSWSAGAVIYINEDTPGELDDAIPADATELVQVMGVATGTDTMFVNPSLDWVVRK